MIQGDEDDDEDVDDDDDDDDDNCPEVGSKIRFRPKNREETELQGENGACDTETSRFHGAHEVRSA